MFAAAHWITPVNGAASKARLPGAAREKPLFGGFQGPLTTRKNIEALLLVLARRFSDELPRERWNGLWDDARDFVRGTTSEEELNPVVSARRPAKLAEAGAS